MGRSVETSGATDDGVGCTKGSRIHSYLDKLFGKLDRRYKNLLRKLEGGIIHLFSSKSLDSGTIFNC